MYIPVRVLRVYVLCVCVCSCVSCCVFVCLWLGMRKHAGTVYTLVLKLMQAASTPTPFWWAERLRLAGRRTRVC